VMLCYVAGVYSLNPERKGTQDISLMPERINSAPYKMS